MAEAGKQAEKGSAEMAKGLEAMAKGLGALAGNADGKAVEPVGFRDLQAVFPEMSGWEKGKPTGEKMLRAGAASRRRTVVYSNGDARIEATIIDSGFNQFLLLPYMWIQNSGYEKETERGYEKAVQVAGFPGLEKWDAAAQGRRAERVRRTSASSCSSKAATSRTSRCCTSSPRPPTSASWQASNRQRPRHGIAAPLQPSVRHAGRMLRLRRAPPARRSGRAARRRARGARPCLRWRPPCRRRRSGCRPSRP